MSTILMRTDLFADARVLRIISATKAPKSAVVGALYWLWSTAQTQSTDGTILCLTPEMIDEQTGVSGFSSALVSVGWLEVGDDAVTIPGFESYFGKSSKTRAKERLKKARQRWDRKNEGANRGHTGDTKGTEGGHEGDKEGTSSGHVGAVDRIGLDRSGSDPSGEDQIPPEPGITLESFERFWAAYPKSGQFARSQCWMYWALNHLYTNAEEILSALDRWKRSERWRDKGGQFIPKAQKFLTEGYWKNPPEAGSSPGDPTKPQDRFAEHRAPAARWFLALTPEAQMDATSGSPEVALSMAAKGTVPNDVLFAYRAATKGVSA